MVKGHAGTAVGTEAGGGGGDIDLSGYVSLPFLRSITWWGRALPEEGTDIVGALTGVTDITMTGAISGTTNLTMTGVISGATGLTMNNGAITGATTITASGLATVGSLRIGDAILEWDNGNNALKIRKSTGANDAVNMYATGGVSALGYASGGGGGGATALTDLVDVAISSPSSGQGLVYDATAGKWKNATLFTAMSYTNNVLSVTVSGVTKTVTIQAGTSSIDWANITNKPDTATRWPSFSEVTSKPDTIAGYGITDAKIENGVITLGSNSITPLTSSDITDMATKTWVNNQNYITSSAISDMATQTWVGNNYLPLSGGTMTGSIITPADDTKGIIPKTNNFGQIGSSTKKFYKMFTNELTADKVIIRNGTSSQFLKADGTVDSNSYLTSVAFSDLTAHPTNIAGYGITDAKIVNGTITLGSNSITPATSSDIADMATKTWVGNQNYAKASALEGYVPLTGSTSLSGTFRPTSNGGAQLGTSTRRFSYVYANYGNLNTKLTIGGFEIEYDSTNQALKFNGSIYATGGVSALGQSSGGSGGSTALTDLVDVATSNVSNGQGLVYDSTSTKWKNATLFTAMSYQNSVLSVTVSGVTKQVTINSGGGGVTTLADLTDTNISSPSSGQALIYNGSKWANSAISMSLGGLSNVVLSSPTNGQVLKYNGTNWTNANESGGGGGSSTLAGLTDVNIIGASGGEVLAYNSSTQKWENMTGYMEETGNSSMSGYFEPSSNGGAQLGRSSWRFSYMYGQHGNFSSDLIIGSIKLTYDSTNNALKVQKTDGTAANLYALGSVSALGFGGGPTSTSISQLTITESLNFPGSTDINYDTDEDKLYFTTGGDGFVFNGDVEINGALNLYLGSGVMNIHGGYLHLNTGKYIYVNGTHLYFYNGSTTITLA